MVRGVDLCGVLEGWKCHCVAVDVTDESLFVSSLYRHMNFNEPHEMLSVDRLSLSMLHSGLSGNASLH